MSFRAGTGGLIGDGSGTLIRSAKAGAAVSSLSEEDLGFGVVGCGVIGPWHREAVNRSEGGRLVACCDIDEAKGRKFAEESGGVALYADYHDLVKDPNVDVVCVCTPSGLHGEVAIAAAEAGKHVLCEKPIEITRKKIDDMISACHKHGVKLGNIFQRRTHRASRMAKDYYGSAGWRGTWALDGGGALMNQGVHGIDLALWIMGDVRSVYGRADHLARDIEVEDTAIALLEYANGAWGVLEGTTSVNPGEPTKLSLHGEKGSIVLEEEKIAKWAVAEGEDERAETSDIDVEGEKDGAASDPTAIGVAGHVFLVNDLICAIREDRDPFITGESARKSVELILAIYESSSSGKAVKLG
jgi:UDP-N-acetyl-2-amino-2-deoxyglucuronate dehydrogenase